MADSSFRSALLSKDRHTCHQFLSNNDTVEKLVEILNDMLFVAVSVTNNSVKNIQPVCVLNSIKNVIGDDRGNPSIALLKFGVDYLTEFEFRANDQSLLDEAAKDGIGLTAFLGDLEDACQQGNWAEVQSLVAKTFIASDRSRGTIDALAEIALQDTGRNAPFIFHLLRGFQFQELKEDSWAYTQCLFYWLDGHPLPDPQDFSDQTPQNIFDTMIQSGDLVLYAAVGRIWEGDYVRSRGYQRELSHWCSQVFPIPEKDLQPNHDHWLLNKSKTNAISAAESIVKSEKSQSEKALALVILEAVRALSKTATKDQCAILGSRLDQAIL